MTRKKITLREICQYIGAELKGDPDCEIQGIAPLDTAKSGDVAFLTNSRYQLVSTDRYQKFLSNTKASGVLLTPSHAINCPTNALVMDNPSLGLVKLASLFEDKQTPIVGIHASTILGKNCIIGENVSIGPHCTVGDDCRIGDNTCIAAGCVIGDKVMIGANCHLQPRVTVYAKSSMGARVIIHAGAVIGAEGFGMIRNEKGWQKIPHLGCVILEDDVEIGANTTIDRGTFGNTLLERGVKLDNQIQVGHNVLIGANTVIAACVGIAGSARIGKNCMIGGATGIADNVVIADNTVITGMAQVVGSIHEPGIYSSGTGIWPQKVWRRMVARLPHLDSIAKRLRTLETT